MILLYFPDEKSHHSTIVKPLSTLRTHSLFYQSTKYLSLFLSQANIRNYHIRLSSFHSNLKESSSNHCLSNFLQTWNKSGYCWDRLHEDIARAVIHPNIWPLDLNYEQFFDKVGARWWWWLLLREVTGGEWRDNSLIKYNIICCERYCKSIICLYIRE